MQAFGDSDEDDDDDDDDDGDSHLCLYIWPLQHSGDPCVYRMPVESEGEPRGLQRRMTMQMRPRRKTQKTRRLLSLSQASSPR